ncbi:MAG TPA: RagB/SusD family nutrient uptake outer membrane protein, partial [Flavobacteriaceae bacterium]
FGLRFKLVIILLFAINVVSCVDFVDIEPPETELITESVFQLDKTALGTIIEIYGQMAEGSFCSARQFSVSLSTSLSSDDYDFYNDPSFGGNAELLYTNSLIPENATIASLWSEPYQFIFKANSIIEGVNVSNTLSQDVKNQLEGEAKFIRAFFHFYLVNLFGDVPLVLTTNYQENNSIERAPTAQVYDKIIADLLDAQNLLPVDFSRDGGERVRPIQATATALLARTYLYVGDWENAEIQATSIINNTSLFSLEASLDNIFLSNSSEAIWQLNGVGNNTGGSQFILSSAPTRVALTEYLVYAFENNDNRRTDWVGSYTDGTNTWYYPYKYRYNLNDPPQEHFMVFRLAEQYLIRAEARTLQNNITGAQADLNMIRNRAGLLNTTASTQTNLLDAIMQERQVELFTEWGHRWLDLKRTNRVDNILGAIKPNWEATDALYPIPQVQIDNNPNTTQNAGY